MMFGVNDFREAFREAYDYGMEHAGPLPKEKLNEMFGDLNALADAKDGKSFLKHELLKAVIAYLCACFKDGKERSSL